jgi:hypothetical protein
MKVEVVDKEENLNYVQYPLLGKSGALIVLFVDRDKGTVIRPNDYYNIGHFSEDWDMSCFKKLEGKVILEND